jgi:hypothetical protein
MPAGEADARHVAAASAKARGSQLYADDNFAQVQRTNAATRKLNEFFFG